MKLLTRHNDDPATGLKYWVVAGAASVVVFHISTQMGLKRQLPSIHFDEWADSVKLLGQPDVLHSELSF